MKAANILPKGLATVETLGCINVLSSDKTGTLTQNKMVVSSTSFLDKQYDVDETMDIISQSNPTESFNELHKTMLLCNDSAFDSSTLALLLQNERYMAMQLLWQFFASRR
jgi:sodium/potassium-transporting ATPase subunit alpha